MVKACKLVNGACGTCNTSGMCSTLNKAVKRAGNLPDSDEEVAMVLKVQEYLNSVNHFIGWDAILYIARLSYNGSVNGMASLMANSTPAQLDYFFNMCGVLIWGEENNPCI